MNAKKSIDNSSKISVKDLDLQTPTRSFLEAMGENLERPDIKDTPKRFEKALKYLLSGYDRNFEEEISVFDNHVKYKNIISLKNIDFFSMCEHHLMPFFGYAHIAYVPSEEKYIGLSKLARVVDIYAKRLQTQEVLSSEVAGAIMKYTEARGVAILMESRHLCAVARGVEKKVSVMATCEYYGIFENNQTLQNQFMELVRERERI